MRKKDNIIHIKLDSNEAVESRRDVLNTEIDLIKIAQNIKNYRALRLKELQLKIMLYKKLKDTQSDMRKIKKLMPKLQIPKILKKHEDEMHKKIEIRELKPKEEDELPEKPTKKKKKAKKKSIKKNVVKEEPIQDPLEDQLRKIQEKLSTLG